MTWAGDDAQRASAVEVVFFDVVETLFALEPVGRRLDAAGAGLGALELWFAGFLRDGFAIAASGSYRTFSDVARGSLTRVLRARGVDPGHDIVEEILAGFAELEPYDDVRPALEHLQSRGVRAMTLTNGGAAATERLLVRAGLQHLVEATHSADETKAWKPRPEPYLAACHAAGVVPDRAAFVAVHSWDVHGAAAAGLVTGWCSRLEGALTSTFNPPTARGATLVEVVQQLG